MIRLKFSRVAILLLTLSFLGFQYAHATNVEQDNGDNKKSSNVVEQYKENKETVKTPDELKQLYAQSACLIDADNGRVLFEKNGSKKLAMASTTKIMTCIVALENGNLNDVVTISSRASKQPDVQMNAREGEQYYLKDLLYSLMLESHNDTAVAIAEHVGGSVEGFAAMMNEKAHNLGCDDTYFITPNGLDASDGNGKHSTTATNLARIMAYCINTSPKKKEFLKITRTANHSFSDLKQRRSISCRNHNAFLSMMDGALSGKTGFTGDAGYCYVGALKKDDKTFVVALLACGWPNNKSYKWSDTKKLMKYGLNNYSMVKIEDVTDFNPILVIDGQEEQVQVKADAKNIQLLLGKDETTKVECDLPDTLMAPVRADELIGSVKYYVNDKLYDETPIYTTGSVDKVDYPYCLELILDMWTLH